jgi:pimeloyl-ACP methyl ester carboxylesterase
VITRGALPAWAAIACIAVAVALSHLVEPGVRVEKVRVDHDIPALKFVPPGPGPHPVAVLAHGVTASKETLFRFGEALAAAGFVCYAFDFPGHGESGQRITGKRIMQTPERVAKALGQVDVFLGHSMGAWVGRAAVGGGGLNPRLYIAVGALPRFGPGGPPLLLLAGRFEEALPLAGVKAQTDARQVISPWSDHALEPYDPYLVNTAVEAACAATGRIPPSAPTRWLWRLAGLWLGMLGAFVLVVWLPALPARWARLRGPVVVGIFIGVGALTYGTWFGGELVWRRAPQQIVFMGVTWLLIVGAGKLRVPRWGFVLLAVGAMLSCVITGIYLLALFMGCGVMVLTLGAVIGAIAARRGTARDGDLAMAIFVGYALGQWMPMLY